MNNLYENKKIIIICVLLIIVVFLLVYLVPKINNNDTTEKNDYSFLKDYKVNEYVPVTITKEAMAKIYITEYKNLMVSDPERAYSYLNEEYKTKKFGSLDNFIEYISELESETFFDYQVSEYKVSGKIFYVKDSTDTLYIFKENSIMQYEVYLDNSTVEIN